MPQGLLDDLKLNFQVPNKIELPAGQVVDLRQVDKAAGEVIDHTTQMAVSASFAIALIIAGWFFSNWLASFTQRGFIKAHMEETLAAFIGSLLRFSVFFAILVFALKLLGLSNTSMAAILGAAGLAVGLALKGTLSHVASGMMLMIHRPFKVSDYIQSKDTEGTVKRIGLFYTEMNTLDNKRIFIPNSVLWDNVLVNTTYNRVRMLNFKFNLAYTDDVRGALAVIKDTLTADTRILSEPEPWIGIATLGDFAMVCEVAVWFKIDDYNAVRLGLLVDLREALTHAGFSVPYPQQVISARPETPPQHAFSVPQKPATLKKTSATKTRGKPSKKKRA